MTTMKKTMMALMLGVSLIASAAAYANEKGMSGSASNSTSANATSSAPAITTDNFSAADADKSGAISRSEYMKAVQSHSRDNSQAQSDFRTLDADGNGELSASELKADQPNG